MEPKYALDTKGKLWTDPQWTVLPSRLWSELCEEDLLHLFDDGELSGASMLLDRGAGCSCL